MCKRERERECVCVRESVRERVCVCERECVCVLTERLVTLWHYDVLNSLYRGQTILYC